VNGREKKWAAEALEPDRRPEFGGGNTRTRFELSKLEAAYHRADKAIQQIVDLLAA
jgi:hypothetical protein